LSSIKNNLVANFIGQAWVALMSLAFIPYYINLLGIEAYGLIGLFALLLVCLSFLDMGIAPTINREMAKYTAAKHSVQQIRDLLRTFETIIIGIGVVVVLIIFFLSGLISRHWVQPESLQISTISSSIIMMGIVIGFRLIESLYRSAIIGLQHQVWLSAVMAFFATLRGLGAVFVLVFISNSIVAFFMWQVMVSFLSVITLLMHVHNVIPVAERAPKFSKSALYKLRKFATSMMLISILALLLAQIDKIILSKMISLEQFGYYTLAATIASILFQFVSPITQVYYPMLTKMILENNVKETTLAFHNAAKLVSIIIFPIALMLIFFGKEIIYIWTKDQLLAANTYPVLQILVLGNLLNCFIQMPYIFQLANGATAWALNVSILAMAVSVPATIYFTLSHGVLGAASVWIFINLGHMFFSIQFIKEDVFHKEKWRWYIYDLLLPIGITLVAFLSLIRIFPFNVSLMLDLVGYFSVFVILEVTLACLYFRPALKRVLCGVRTSRTT
jgi:O-antigen/teichoic acid export membrane protein